MKLTKIEPKFINNRNPRIGLITLASDFRIEKDFNNVIYGKDVDLYCNRIHCYNPLTNETLRKMADDIPKVTEDILPDQKLDCVAYGCTSGTIAAGYQYIVEKVNLAKPNTKVTTPITSAINALKTLKINKLSIFTPYTDEINQSVINYFKKENIDILELSYFSEIKMENVRGSRRRVKLLKTNDIPPDSVPYAPRIPRNVGSVVLVSKYPACFCLAASPAGPMKPKGMEPTSACSLGSMDFAL